MVFVCALWVFFQTNILFSVFGISKPRFSILQSDHECAMDGLERHFLTPKSIRAIAHRRNMQGMPT